MFSLRSGDEEFINRPGGRDAGTGLWLLLVAVLTLMGGFVVWAAIFEIEEVTRASGRVVPSSQVQSVQAPDGGVVTAIEVREGDVVSPGQILFQIDDTGVQASLGELEQRYQALTAELLRLRAEASGAETLEFPDGHGLNPRAVEAQSAIFETRRKQLAIELDVLRDRLAQRRAERRELTAKRNRLEAVAAPLRREVEISEELFADGTFSEIEILRLRAQLAEIEGDLLVLSASEERAEANIAEIETQMVSAANFHCVERSGGGRGNADRRPRPRITYSIACARPGHREPHRRNERGQRGATGNGHGRDRASGRLAAYRSAGQSARRGLRPRRSACIGQNNRLRLSALRRSRGGGRADRCGCVTNARGYALFPSYAAHQRYQPLGSW